MSRINRLLSAAHATGQWAMTAFIDVNDGRCDVSYSFWNGVDGTGGKYGDVLQCDTLEAAEAAVEQARLDFPFALRNFTCLVDDLVPAEGMAAHGTP